MRKEERDMETDTSITKDKVTFCIFILVVIWYTLLWMGPVISELYIQQQQHVPIAMKAASMAFPFLVILAAGAFVLFKIVFNYSLPLALELVVMTCFLLFIFNINSMKSPHIEYYIRDSELKAACYKTVIVLYNTSALCIPLIWYVVRFIERTPVEFGKLNLILDIYIYFSPIAYLLSFILIDILKAYNLLPKVF